MDGCRKCLSKKKLPCVWELDNNGVISYFIGTMHMMRNFFEEDVIAKLNGMENLLLECRPDELAAHGQDILDITFDEFTEDEIKNFADALGLSYKKLKEISSRQFNSYMFDPDNYEQYSAVDHVLFDHAKAQGINVAGLETIEERLALVQQNRTLASIIRMERNSPGSLLKFGPILREKMQMMMDEYVSGRCDLMSDSEGAKEEDVKRNSIMCKRSLPYLAKPSIVAAGIVHAVEKPSMLTMYKEHGIKVKKV